MALHLANRVMEALVAAVEPQTTQAAVVMERMAATQAAVVAAVVRVHSVLEHRLEQAALAVMDSSVS